MRERRSRWGPAREEGREGEPGEGSLLAALAATLPHRWMPQSVLASEGIRPRDVERGVGLVAAYERVVDAMQHSTICGECNVCAQPVLGGSASAQPVLGESASAPPVLGRCDIAPPVLRENRDVTTPRVWSVLGKEQMLGAKARNDLQPVAHHMQRCMVGYIQAKIDLAHQYLASHAYAENGEMTARHHRCVTRVNHALIPWINALCKIVKKPTYEKLDRWWSSEGMPKIENDTPLHTVYARINTKNDDMYIGETENWERRQIQHTYMTFKHSRECKKPCTGCRDHKKYPKHKSANAHEWITVPLATAPNKVEARRIEKLLVKTLRPNINAREVPFWLLRDNYTQDLRQTKSMDKREAPWKRTEKAKPICNSQRITRYETATGSGYDLENILDTHVKKEVTIYIKMGHHDLTNWSHIRTFYADTEVHVQTTNAEYTVPMKEWTPRTHSTLRTTKYYKITLTPEKQVVTDRTQTLKEMIANEKYLETASEEDLAFLWRVRKAVDESKKYHFTKMLYNEYEQRYDCHMRPITCEMPYLRDIDIKKTKKMILDRIEAQCWPKYLKDWHTSQLKIVTKSSPNLGEILINVTQPKKLCKRCTCKRVEANCPNLPRTDGHILFTGRDLEGEGKKVMGVNATNVPRTTWYDNFRAWERLRTQLPVTLRDAPEDWKNLLFKCLNKKDNWNGRGSKVPNTKEVYCLKRKLKGLVIGPLDKNMGELWGCCPHLYQKMLANLYTEDTGYETIYPTKMSAYRKKKSQTTSYPRRLSEPRQHHRTRGERKKILSFSSNGYTRQTDGTSTPHSITKEVSMCLTCS